MIMKHLYFVYQAYTLDTWALQIMSKIRVLFCNHSEASALKIRHADEDGQCPDFEFWQLVMIEIRLQQCISMQAARQVLRASAPLVIDDDIGESAATVIQ